MYNCSALEGSGSGSEACVPDIVSSRLRVWVWLLNGYDSETLVIRPLISLRMTSFVHKSMS
jgi:hypothetical protein